MKISQFRAEVIEKTINLEWIVNAIISQHFFGYLKKGFLLDVLYDEMFSSGLKLKILFKIVPDFERKQENDLRRIFSIRNLFAHCNQSFYDGDPKSHNNSTPGRVINPKDSQKSLNFEQLHAEFVSIIEPTELYLSAKFKEKGGEFLE